MQLFQQEGNSGIPPGQNRAAGGLAFALRRHGGLAHLIVERGGLAGPACGAHFFGCQNASFGQRGRLGRAHRRLPRLRQSRPQSLRGGGATDLPEGHSGGLGHGGLGSGELFGQHLNCGGIAAHADRIDHPHQQIAGELFGSLPQCPIGSLAGDGLQRNSGPGGEMFVGKQFRQIGHGVGGTDHSQFFAGERLIGLGSTRPQHCDQLLLRRRLTILSRGRMSGESNRDRQPAGEAQPPHKSPATNVRRAPDSG